MKIHELRAEPGFRLWVRFEDGVEGQVDLSPLRGRGVFAIWDTPGVFERARIGATGEVAWGDEVDLCADALYIRVTGHRPAGFVSRAPAAHA
jgi:hypothetical protein